MNKTHFYREMNWLYRMSTMYAIEMTVSCNKEFLTIYLFDNFVYKTLLSSVLSLHLLVYLGCYM